MELGLKLENLMKTAKHGELLLIKNEKSDIIQVIKQGSKETNKSIGIEICLKGN